MKILKILTIMFLVFFGSQSNLSAIRIRNGVPEFNLAQNAAQRGDINALRTLITSNANKVNKANYGGWTPLLLAIKNGHTDIVQLLLEIGINPNQINDDGSTPLMIAAQNGHTDIVRILLERGANPNQPCFSGHEALKMAAQNGHIDIVRILLKKGVDPNRPSFCGHEALRMAARNGHTDIVHILLQRGVDPNQPDYRGRTALRMAAQNGHIDIVRILLKNGADPNQPDRNGSTPLMVAHVNVVQLLIEKGANPNQINKSGYTATIYARCLQKIERNETLTSWYLKSNPYSMSFLNLLASKEFADTDLPHGLRAHRAILTARLEKWTTTKLKKTLALMSKREAKDFLFWIYTGITQNTQKGQIVKTCQDLDINYKTKNGPFGFRNDMRKLYDRKGYTYNKEAGDFTIVLGKREIVEYKAVPAKTIQVHRTILAARSNMFRDMFLNTTDTSDKVRDRSGLSLPAFNAIMEFIYTGQITNLTREIANELLEEMAALFFQLPEGELEEYLEQVI